MRFVRRLSDYLQLIVCLTKYLYLVYVVGAKQEALERILYEQVRYAYLSFDPVDNNVSLNILSSL